ncbi:hypothetical protein [Pseudomonas aeruginosa]|uniref:hypothetical protein n=1 Tax=Pseudomonas aeruginosa TaxID=287 RepID=UPI000450A854|nr:hypothetical protein [Pseudomonas aeruginosa]EZO27022.1 hypothetical protein AJ62_01634 [Pseudomonas aeruginosa 3575]MDJ1426720.1 hypothetical protein [Pseudomonas aeruginosa]RTT16901.1 hypothetical protein DY955_15770 [Pseudomonas aeruginosa]HEH8637661.1 hypothetical protein [Pseudomonas aeruginosa]
MAITPLPFVLLALSAGTAFGAGNIGNCVYPKVKVGVDSNLDFVRDIQIYQHPNPASYRRTLDAYASFSITDEVGDYVQLTTTPDYSQAAPYQSAGASIGWAKLADIDFQEFRNCN